MKMCAAFFVLYLVPMALVCAAEPEDNEIERYLRGLPSRNSVGNEKEKLVAPPAPNAPSTSWMPFRPRKIERGGYEFTPLEKAIWHRNDAAKARLLLAQGAELDICTAAGLGMIDRVTTFLQQDRKLIDDRSSWHYTPLHWAIKGGQVEVARLLLDNKADPDATGGMDAVTPLNLAICCQNATLAKLVIDHGATVNTDYQSPLQTAVRYGDREMVQVLLASGARVNGREMHNGFIQDFSPSSFLAGDYKDDTPPLRGNTPLHLAAEHGHDYIVSMLLAHGANVNDIGNEGCTALELALRGNHWEVARLLSNHGGTTKKQLLEKAAM